MLLSCPRLALGLPGPALPSRRRYRTRLIARVRSENGNASTEVSTSARTAAALLSISLALGAPCVGFVLPQEAHGTEEAADAATAFSPSERRKLQAERRQQLLDKVREGALRNGASTLGEAESDADSTAATTAAPARPVPNAGVTSPFLSKKLDNSAYDKALRKGPSLPSGAAPAPSTREGQAAPSKPFEFPFFSTPKFELPSFSPPKADVPTPEVPQAAAKVEPPRITTPSQPELKPSLPALQSPSQPELQSPPREFKAPSSPELQPSQPAKPPATLEFKAPALPEFKVPPLPEFKQPALPEFKSPEFKAPEFKAPEFKAPALPDFKAPTMPKFQPPPALKGLTLRPSAPKPAPAVPAPAPAAKLEEAKPAPVPSFPFAPAQPTPSQPATPAPQKVAAQPAAQQKKSSKRRGPLPLWLAELVVLGSYVGLVLAFTKYSEQTGAALRAAGQLVVKAYTAIEQRTTKP